MFPMPLPDHILLQYGYLILFAWVFVEQLGLPLPAMPVLLAAGALTVEGEMNFLLALAAGTVASLVADMGWYWAGRRWGHSILGLMCRMSLEPTVCVRRTQNSYGHRGKVTLVLAKFVPGLATLAPPVAGQNGMILNDFLLYDGLGSVLWVGGLLAAGRLFGNMLNGLPRLLDWIGRISGLLLVLGVLGFFLGRVIRRRNVLRKLSAARLEPEELKAQLDRGESVYIVDLRHPLELIPDPVTLPGALRIAPDALASRQGEIPRDRDVVLFCSCPSEATAAKTAMTLHRLGIERVRPLRGGLDEWRRLGFPVMSIDPAAGRV
jgi:membrane protein DedA with SNARE-associated domain/rhodanese-related sulfurtransferase